MKLCDFGSVCDGSPRIWQTDQEKYKLEDEIARFTTPSYRAPELIDLSRRKPISTKIDIWALGCMFFVMAFLYPPFPGDYLNLEIINWKKDNIPTDHPFSEKVPQLITKLLSKDPAKRPTAAELIHHIENILAGGPGTISMKHKKKKQRPASFMVNDEKNINNKNSLKTDNQGSKTPRSSMLSTQSNKDNDTNILGLSSQMIAEDEAKYNSDYISDNDMGNDDWDPFGEIEEMEQQKLSINAGTNAVNNQNLQQIEQKSNDNNNNGFGDNDGFDFENNNNNNNSNIQNVVNSNNKPNQNIVNGNLNVNANKNNENSGGFGDDFDFGNDFDNKSSNLNNNNKNGNNDPFGYSNNNNNGDPFLSANDEPESPIPAQQSELEIKKKDKKYKKKKKNKNKNKNKIIKNQENNENENQNDDSNINNDNQEQSQQSQQSQQQQQQRPQQPQQPQQQARIKDPTANMTQTQLEEYFGRQLGEMEAMGFTDTPKNILALRRARGNLEVAMNLILQ